MLTSLPWGVKALALATLSRVPLGHQTYRALQGVTGGTRLHIDRYYEQRARGPKALVEAGHEIENRDVLEIGTGWHPLVPLIYYLLGARRVVTVDTNPWLTPDSFHETIVKTLAIQGKIEEDFSGHCSGMGDRFSALRGMLATPSSSLEETRQQLLSLGIDYRCPCDATATGLEKDSIDFVVSASVYEHIPPQKIRTLFREIRRVLKPGGIHATVVNPSDHFSFGREITGVNFLQFSPQTWYWIGGSGLAYHNRLRCCDYTRLMESIGFFIRKKDSMVEESALQALREGSLIPHRDYDRYTDVELAEAVILILAEKPDTPRLLPAKANLPIGEQIESGERTDGVEVEFIERFG